MVSLLAPSYIAEHGLKYTVLQVGCLVTVMRPQGGRGVVQQCRWLGSEVALQHLKEAWLLDVM